MNKQLQKDFFVIFFVSIFFISAVFYQKHTPDHASIARTTGQIFTTLFEKINFNNSKAQVANIPISYTAPTLPQAFVSTTYPPMTGTSRIINAGGDLQAALNAAQPGDEIVLANGATFTGNFTLPNKPGSGTIVIRAETIPVAPGVRMNPSAAVNVAKVITPNTQAAISTASGAQNYRLVGFEITQSNQGTTQNYGILVLGSGNETALSQLPNNIILDRMYIHAYVNGNTSRCVAFNGISQAVIDSWLGDCHGKGFDAQGVGGWGGPGPYLIENNHIEGSGQGVMFGGADPRIVNVSPSDITVRHNYFYKPLSWGNGKWSVKAAFELKHGKRVLFEGNVIENHWINSQVGFAILFQTLADNNTSWAWTTVQDVMVRNNIIKNSTSGANVLSRVAYGGGPLPTNPSVRIAFVNNLFQDVGRDPFTGQSGISFQLLNDLTDTTIINNTITMSSGSSNSIISLDGKPQLGTIITNNIFPASSYGIKGNGTGSGNSSLSLFAPGSIVTNNVIPAQSSNLYPPSSFFPQNASNIGFSNPAGGDFSLLSSSPYYQKGAGGADIGVNWAQLQSAVSGATTGGSAYIPPTPPPVSPPVVVTPAPTLSFTAQGMTLSWSTTNATSCSATNGWSGGKLTSGTQTLSPTQSTTYTLTCTGSGGSVNQSVTLSPALPTVTLSASPSSITVGGSSVLTWSASNATSCTASGAWSGSKGTSGTQSLSPTTAATYTLSCTGAGTATQSVTITVSQPTVTLPTVTLTASPSSITEGSAATLTWSTTNATTCLASGAWSGTRGTSGSISVSPTSASTYIITCSNSGGSANQSATISVSAAPVVSNPDVTPTTPTLETPQTSYTPETPSNNSTGSISYGVPAPLISFSVDSATIQRGQTFTLRWSAVNASSCTASGGWTGAKPVSGSESLIAEREANYILICTGNGGSRGKYVTIYVTSGGTYLPPPQTQNPIAPISSPAPNTAVRVTDSGVSVRSEASATSRRLGTQSRGARGQITAGPIVSGGYTWFKVNFESGVDGYMASLFLTEGDLPAIASPSTPAISITPRPTESRPTESGGRLSVGSIVRTTSSVSVRYSPSSSSLPIGLKAKAATGKIISGPVTAGGVTWWKVDFYSGADGWVGGGYLTQ